MPVSKPMKTASYLLRLSPDEKARLEQLAAERDVTLAYALREGARLYLEDARERGGRVAASGP